MLRRRASIGKKNRLEPLRCWQAVKMRDRKWDGVFVYGVRSTRIYCRPSCPARRPGRNTLVSATSYDATLPGSEHGSLIVVIHSITPTFQRQTCWMGKMGRYLIREEIQK